jgi:nucleoid-associated protein YgaU
VGPTVAPLAARSAAERRRLARQAMLARRRRIAAVLAGAAVFGTLWFGLGALAAAGRGPAAVPLAGARPVAGGQLYVAHPGDTLWSIALRVDPNGDPRPLVDALNAQLHGRPLEAGMRLLLPR